MILHFVKSIVAATHTQREIHTRIKVKIKVCHVGFSDRIILYHFYIFVRILGLIPHIWLPQCL